MNIRKILFGILLISCVIVIPEVLANKSQKGVLSSSSSQAPIATPIPSPTPTLTPTPSPTPTPLPTPTIVLPPKIAPELIHVYIERFSAQYGADPNVLRHLAVCEAGFNPLAINGKYVGLFQFDKTTWQNNRRPMGEDANPDLRFNAEEATQTAAYLVSTGKKELWPNCYP